MTIPTFAIVAATVLNLGACLWDAIELCEGEPGRRRRRLWAPLAFYGVGLLAGVFALVSRVPLCVLVAGRLR